MIDKKILTFWPRGGPTAVGAARAGLSRIKIARVFKGICICFYLFLLSIINMDLIQIRYPLANPLLLLLPYSKTHLRSCSHHSNNR